MIVWLRYRRVWVSCVSLWGKMLSSMFIIFWKRLCLGMRELVQWRKKCILDSISLPHSHKGFKVSWKQCLNLCSWRWLRWHKVVWSKKHLFKSIEACWVSDVNVKFVPLWDSRRKKWVFEIIMAYFYWRKVIAKLGYCEPY